MPKFKDYTNQVMGRLKLLSVHKKERGGTSWLCQCQCGNECIKSSVYLRTGKHFECEPCRQERRRADKLGQVINRWTILSRAPNSHNNKTMWNCRCECGIERIVADTSLNRPRHSMSCGCLGRKLKSKWVNDTFYPPSHLKSKERLYAIRERICLSCYNEKHPTYKLYGAKGYVVCELWKNGAKDFVEWAILNKWDRNHVVGIREGYFEFNPENCFVMPEGEYISMTRKKKVSINGITKTVDEWAEEYKIKPLTLKERLLKYDPETAVKLRPHQNSGRNFKIKNEDIRRLYIEENLSLHGISRKLGCTYNTVSSRLRECGITPENGCDRRKYSLKKCVICKTEFTPITANQKCCKHQDCKRQLLKKRLNHDL